MSFLRKLARKREKFIRSSSQHDGGLTLASITFYSADWSRVLGVSIVRIPFGLADKKASEAACQVAKRTHCNPGGNVIVRGPFLGLRASQVPADRRHRLMTPAEAHALDDLLHGQGDYAPQSPHGASACACCGKTLTPRRLW